MVAPGWVAAVLPIRMLAQRVVERVVSRGLDNALDIARAEHARLTTELPDPADARADGNGDGTWEPQTPLRHGDAGEQ